MSKKDLIWETVHQSQTIRRQCDEINRLLEKIKKMKEENAVTYNLEINLDPITEGKLYACSSRIVKENSKILEVNEIFIKNLAEELSKVKDKNKKLNDELAEKDRLIGNLARELAKVNSEELEPKDMIIKGLKYDLIVERDKSMQAVKDLSRVIEVHECDYETGLIARKLIGIRDNLLKG